MRLFFAILILTGSAAYGEDINGEISPFGDAVHVEFKGRQNWDYSLKKDGRKMILSLQRVDEQTLERFKSWSGSLVDHVTIEDGQNKGHNIIFHLKAEAIDSFDYLTDQPSRLVIDFFKEKPEDIKQVAVTQPPTEKTIVPKNAKAETTQPKAGLARQLPPKKSGQKGRTPAGEILVSQVAAAPKAESAPEEAPKFGIFDGGDPNFSRFEIKDHEIKENSVIASQLRFYLEFPMLELPPVSLKELWETPPIYEIKPEDNDENKKARLLLTLFNKQRYAVFLKTLEFFEKDYPNSKYKELVKYLEADVFYEMWKQDNSPSNFESALSRYHALVEKYPKSPLAERTNLLIGYSYLSRGDNLGALKSLQRYARNFSESENVPMVKLAIADSFRNLKSFDEAVKIYDELEVDPKAGAHGINAAFKRGDVYFSKKQYEKAVLEYQNAIKKYSTDSKDYPNSFYNLSESLFQLKKYREGLNAYRAFLDRFPRSSHGGFAMTRIGELLEILGADAKKINGAFLESVFRYQGSVGAGVARIRILSDRMPEMKEKEVQAAMSEIKKFEETAGLPKVKEFSVVMAADGYTRRREFRKARNLLIDFYQNNPTAQLDFFKNRILDNIAEEIHTNIESGKYLEALQTQAEYASAWLKKSERVDIDFYLGQSYEKTGLYNEAEDHYKRALNNLYAIAGTPLEKKKRVSERLPEPEQILLRLASVSWAKEDAKRTYENLENIKNSDRLNPEERVERISIAAQVAVKKGQTEPARRYLQELVSTWKGQPSKVSKPLFSIVELDMGEKRYKDALVNLEKIIKMSEDSEQVSPEILAQSLDKKSECQLALGEIDQAILTKKLLLEKFEDAVPLESNRYQLGLLYFKKGRLSEAEKTWASIKADTVWARLAKEQMDHSKWKDEYKKYLKRIPAMSETVKEKQ
jgi:tetratricopeptide (TPR) repeat protein